LVYVVACGYFSNITALNNMDTKKVDNYVLYTNLISCDILW